MAVLAFAVLTTKSVDVLADGGHGDSDPRLDLALDILDPQPGGALDIDEPELVQESLLGGGATVD